MKQHIRIMKFRDDTVNTDQFGFGFVDLCMAVTVSAMPVVIVSVSVRGVGHN